jgi:hypothetical protein
MCLLLKVKVSYNTLVIDRNINRFYQKNRIFVPDINIQTQYPLHFLNSIYCNYSWTTVRPIYKRCIRDDETLCNEQRWKPSACIGLFLSLHVNLRTTESWRMFPPF